MLYPELTNEELEQKVRARSLIITSANEKIRNVWTARKERENQNIVMKALNSARGLFTNEAADTTTAVEDAILAQAIQEKNTSYDIIPQELQTQRRYYDTCAPRMIGEKAWCSLEYIYEFGNKDATARVFRIWNKCTGHAGVPDELLHEVLHREQGMISDVRRRIENEQVFRDFGIAIEKKLDDGRTVYTLPVGWDITWDWNGSDTKRQPYNFQLVYTSEPKVFFTVAQQEKILELLG